MKPETREGSTPSTPLGCAVLLTAMDAASGPEELNNPGFRLHALKGERKGQWAVTVSGNWRLVFEFEAANITNVDLVDYH